MDDFETQQSDLRSRAQAARQGTRYQNPQGRMVGRIYVAPNPLEYLSEALRSAGAGRDAQMATGEMKELSAKRNQAMTDTTTAYVNALRGTPEKRTEMPQEMFVADDAGGGEMTMGTNTQVTPAVAPDLVRANQILMQSPDPAMRTAGMTGMARIPEMEAKQAELAENRAFRKEEAEATRQARMDALQLQHEQRLQMMQDQQASREQMAEAQRQHQAQMAQLTASMRPERNVTVMGPDGSAITMPQSQAQGMQLYNPQAAQQLQKSKTKAEAKEQLSGVVQQLNNSYTALEKGGGITSTGQGTLANIRAAAGSSGIGQAIGGALGTENQRQRQEIEQTRPLLLNLIKEATGMSAQQMNSNAEMNLYLKAATDPTLSVEANRSALANLDKMFGLGLAQRPEESGATSQRTVTRTGTVNGRKVVQYSDGTTEYAD
jgi:hypothetical protein